MSLLENIQFTISTSTCIAWEGICYFLGRERIKCIKNIANYLSTKNIIYSKIFQSLSSGASLLTNEEMLYLSKFNDEAPYMNDELWDVGAIIKNVNISTGKELEINELPIKSGMIALAYKGTLNGKQIIVKIKRKNIYKKLLDGINKMDFIMSLTKYIPYLNILSLPDVFNENREEMLKQVDFKNELTVSEKFYNNFKLIDEIIIPQVYRDFTEADNRIIVMDYIDGKTIHQLDKDARFEYGDLIAKFSMKSILYDRLYHNDLHAGNIFFLEENGVKKIGVIDFGATGTITREQQDIFYEFFKHGSINKDYCAARDVVVNDLIYPKEVYNNLDGRMKESLLNELTALTRDCFNSVKTIDVELIYNLNNCLHRYNLKLSRYFCKIQLSMGIAGTVCNELCNGEEGKNFMTCIGNAVNKMVKQQESMFEY